MFCYCCAIYSTPQTRYPAIGMPIEAVSVVLRRLIQNPWQEIALRWNWKSAITSAIIRAAIYFTVNLSSGRDADGAQG